MNKEKQEEEIFHIIHSELWRYNEDCHNNNREGEKTYLLDKTIGKMSKRILKYMKEVV